MDFDSSGSRLLPSVADLRPGFPIFWLGIRLGPDVCPVSQPWNILAFFPPLPPPNATRAKRRARVWKRGLVGGSKPKIRPMAMPKKHIFRCFPWCSPFRPSERQGVIRLAAICRDLPRSAAKQRQKPG